MSALEKKTDDLKNRIAEQDKIVDEEQNLLDDLKEFAAALEHDDELPRWNTYYDEWADWIGDNPQARPIVK